MSPGRDEGDPLENVRALLTTYMENEGATSGQILARLNSLLEIPVNAREATAWDLGHRACVCDRPGSRPCRNPYEAGA